MHNRHPIVTGVMLGVALSWGVAKLNPPLVGHLTGVVPVAYDDLVSILATATFYHDQLKECREKKGA